MEILGYEINIYMVIVIVVGIFVTTVILLIASHMGKKKVAGKNDIKIGSKARNASTREKGKSQKAISANQPEKSVRPQLIRPIVKSANKDVTKKNSGENTENPLENSSPLSTGDPSNKPEEKNSKQPGYSSRETVDMSTAVGGSATEENTSGGATSLLFDPGKNAETKSGGEKTPEDAKLPESTEATAEAKSPEGTEEAQEKKGGGSLMDIFEDEDLEESESTGLASLMTDVDLSTLSKLSEEISQVLSKHKTGTTRRQ